MHVKLIFAASAACLVLVSCDQKPHSSSAQAPAQSQLATSDQTQQAAAQPPAADPNVLAADQAAKIALEYKVTNCDGGSYALQGAAQNDVATWFNKLASRPDVQYMPNISTVALAVTGGMVRVVYAPNPGAIITYVSLCPIIDQAMKVIDITYMPNNPKMAEVTFEESLVVNPLLVGTDAPLSDLLLDPNFAHGAGSLLTPMSTIVVPGTMRTSIDFRRLDATGWEVMVNR